ncbi:MAG: gliding motility lipoprotein GldB, partial [Bacteroidetes bacterium]
RHLAVEAVMGDIPAHEVLGYSLEEYNFLVENERQIWEVLVREKLLFSTDMMVRQRLVEPAPFSKMGTAMDAEIPGRVAQFIGYRMMRSFAKKSELTLEELLKIRDAQRILRDAQYKP